MGHVIRESRWKEVRETDRIRRQQQRDIVMNVNKVLLGGRLGKDPEVKQVGSTSVCNFTLATNENWTDKSGEKQQRTEWHNVVVWGKVAELCGQYLKKGSGAFLEGRLQTRSWDDKDGNKRYTTEIVAMSVQFTDSKADAAKVTPVKTEENAQQSVDW